MKDNVKKSGGKKSDGMRFVNRLAMIAAKTAEVLHWLGAVAMLALLICSVAAQDWLSGIFAAREGDFELTSHGFNISALTTGGDINITAITMFSIAAILIMFLFAMIFRNAYLILKTADGKTWFSKGDTPFQKDVVRMLREIGIFLIAVPAVGLIMSVAARCVIGVDNAEISVDLSYVIVGLLMLCLSHFFDYGMALQEDVDGLL